MGPRWTRWDQHWTGWSTIGPGPNPTTASRGYQYSFILSLLYQYTQPYFVLFLAVTTAQSGVAVNSQGTEGSLRR